jgi:hypothetical protein
MFRIDHPTAVGALPAPGVAGAGGYFQQGAPGSGQQPTVLTADWANLIQEEIVAAVLGGGLALNKADHTQLYQAIQAIASGAGSVGSGSIFGLTLSNTPGNPTTRITISAGLVRDSLNAKTMVLAAPLSKRLDQAWAVGANNGGRDTGALANGQTWHVFAILKDADQSVDALFSQSPNAPTMPAGYTKFRRLGAIVLDAAATTIRQFVQTGDWFKYVTRSTDFANQANGGGVATLRSLAVPTGIKVEAELYFQSNGTIDNNPYLSGLFDPDMGVPAAFGGAAQWAQIRRIASQTPGGTQYAYGTVVCRQYTDTSGRVYTFSSDNAADVIALGVLGWRDERGKFF